MNDPKSIIEPIGGWFVDGFAKLRNRPFVPHSLTKLQNIIACRDLSGARTAVEIGSFKGVMTKRLSYFFDKVISVEIDESLYRIAKERCRRRNNVELIQGDGTKLLGSISARVERALIFLDGHFSGGATGHGDVPEPVLQEVDLMQQHMKNYVGVVVDDFRLFGVEKDWPSKGEVLHKMEETFPHPQWNINVMNDQIIAYRQKVK